MENVFSKIVFFYLSPTPPPGGRGLKKLPPSLLGEGGKWDESNYLKQTPCNSYTCHYNSHH
jgi:hypothetical protein